MKAFLDANVFLTAWTFDALLSIAEKRLFDPWWSSEIEEEVFRSVESVRPTGLASMRKACADAQKAFAGACGAHCEPLSHELELPDPNDIHVVEAAVSSGCEVIVTYNLRDFPDAVLKPLGLRAIHPDEFLRSLACEHPEVVLDVMRGLVANKRHPPRTMAEEIEGLRRNRLQRFADWLAAGGGRG